MSNSTSSNLSVSDSSDYLVGGMAFFYEYFHECFPYLFFNGVGVVFGIVGNLMIMGAVACSKELRKSATNIMIFNLAIADLLISGIVDTFIFVGVLAGQAFFNRHMILCRLVASVCGIVCIASMMSIALLSLNRYVLVCQNEKYQRVFRLRNTILFCILAWLISIGLDLPNWFGWGGLGYDTKQLMCIWDRTASRSYTLFFPIIGIIMPSVIVFINYMRIYLYLRRKHHSGTHGNDQLSERAERQKNIRITQGLFASFIFFLVCSSPYGLVVMIDAYNTFPRPVHMMSIILVHMNSAINPIIYAVVNPAFRRGYWTLLHLIFPFIFRKSRVSSGTIINSSKVTNQRRQVTQLIPKTCHQYSVSPVMTGKV